MSRLDPEEGRRLLLADQAYVHHLAGLVRKHRTHPCTEAPLCPGQEALTLIANAGGAATTVRWLIAAVNLVADHAEGAERADSMDAMFAALTGAVADELAAQVAAFVAGEADGDRPA